MSIITERMYVFMKTNDLFPLNKKVAEKNPMVAKINY